MFEVVLSIFWGSKDPWTGVPWSPAQPKPRGKGLSARAAGSAYPTAMPPEPRAVPSPSKPNTRQGEK